MDALPVTEEKINTENTAKVSSSSSHDEVTGLVVPGATPYKYYQVPEGFKGIRTKRKVALLFAYIGERYCGLQWNHLPNYPTVEAALLKALFETDMISLTNFTNPKVQQLLNFERASRTDKGVHALCNLVSVNLMLPYDPDYIKEELVKAKEDNAGDETKTGDTFMQSIDTPVIEGVQGGVEPVVTDTFRSFPVKRNEREEVGGQRFSCLEAKRLLRLALPPDIHLYNVVPVTRSFNAYLCCGGRKYEYFIPSFAFMNKDEYSTAYFPSNFALSHPTLKDVGFRPGKRLPASDRRQPHQVSAGGKGKGRKSRGHFPKSKKRRQEDAAKQIALEEEKKNQKESIEVKEEDIDDSENIEKDEEEEDESEMDHNIDIEDPEALEQFLSSHYATHFQDHLFESMVLFRSIPQDRMLHIGGYRISEEQLAYIRLLFSQYEGTHCYHNFTPGGRSTDASCHRYMKRITVSDPILWSADDPLLESAIRSWTPSCFYTPDSRLTDEYADARQAVRNAYSGAKPDNSEEDESLREQLRDHLRRVYPQGIEVLRIELDGQSFMLNQIRKMIGAIVCMTSAGLPSSFLEETLLMKGCHLAIPMVPANGLLLSYMDFSGYGNRLSRIQKNGNNGTGKNGIDVDALMPSEEVQAQERRIVSVMLRNEMANDVMGKWMRSLRHAVRLAWKLEIP